MKKVLIVYPLPLEPDFSEDITIVERNWLTLPDAEQLKSAFCNIEGIVALLTHKLDRSVLQYAPNLKVIANYAVGYNNIDIEYCNERGIIVTNTPDVLTGATAEVAMGLLLTIMRRFPEAAEILKAGAYKGWQPGLCLGTGLEGKIVGIIGAGRIGQRFARYISGFQPTILYYNRNRLPKEIERKLNLLYAPLEQIARQADVISIHTPLSPETVNLIDDQFLEKMKPGSYIVNTARGEVINEEALLKHIDKLGGVGLDVFTGEPVLNPNFKDHPKLFVLPHIGSAARESREKMAAICYRNVVAVLNGEPAITPVTS